MINYNELRDGQKFYANGYKKGYEDAKKEFERPTGHWIPIEPDCRGYTEVFECSHCKNRVKYHYCMKKSEYPNCPYCLADMGG